MLHLSESSHVIRKIRKAGAVAIAALLPGMAIANSLEAVPTAWRLENYVSDHKVVLWYTGSECANGNLSAAMSQDDYNRLWSLVMTSKITNRPVGIRYDVSAGVCTIVSFYAP